MRERSIRHGELTWLQRGAVSTPIGLLIFQSAAKPLISMRGRWGGFSSIALNGKGIGPLPKLNVVGSIPIARSSFQYLVSARRSAHPRARQWFCEEFPASSALRTQRVPILFGGDGRASEESPLEGARVVAEAASSNLHASSLSKAALGFGSTRTSLQIGSHRVA